MLNREGKRSITYYDIRNVQTPSRVSNDMLELKNKAMSHVVAVIILVAVTIATSIAVAAWTGALTFSYMATESLQIQGCRFQSEGVRGVNMAVHNDGTTDTTINKFKIANTANPCEITDVHIAQGDTVNVFLPFNWTSGIIYDIFLITVSGKQFPY